MKKLFLLILLVIDGAILTLWIIQKEWLWMGIMIIVTILNVINVLNSEEEK